MTLFSVVTAVSKNGIIGHQNRLPWHLPEELAYFKKITLNKPVLMGRKTFDSLGGKPLPQRPNIVLSRTAISHTHIQTVLSLPEALAITQNCPEVMVIGGYEIYKLFLPLASKLYISVIHQNYAGDTPFPSLDWWNWQCVKSTDHRDFTSKVFERIEKII